MKKMAKNSSNDDSMTSELKNKKKSKKERSKSVSNENEDDIIKSDVKSKKHKRKKSKVSEEQAEELSPKKAKKINSKKSEDEEEETEEKEGETTSKEKTPSKRQLKRDKKAIKESEKRDASKQESMNKALNYISTWKHARNQWKFEKLKQIWLMDHLLDDALVPDEFFPTVLEYFEGCKGMARETLLKKGMDVIKKYEQQQETSEELEEPVEYKRARQLLQALPTET